MAKRASEGGPSVIAEASPEVSEAVQEPLAANDEATTVDTITEGAPATPDSAPRTRRPRGRALSLDEKRKKVDRWLTLRANGGKNDKVAEIVEISYPTFLKYQKEIAAVDGGQPEKRVRATASSPAAPRIGRSSESYIIEFDARTLVAANRQAVINALLVGKHEAIKKAVLDLIEG